MISNILFKFINESTFKKNMLISKKDIFDKIFVFNEFLIKMLKEFKMRVQAFYIKNKK